MTEPFCIDSSHIAGMLRARSRAVRTASTSVSGKEPLIWAIFCALRGPRNSMEITAVPGHALTSSTTLCHGPAGSTGSCSGPPWPIRSCTALTWAFQRGPGKSTPCSASRSLLSPSTFWMKLVPDFIEPMCSTRRSATDTPQSQPARGPR